MFLVYLYREESMVDFESRSPCYKSLLQHLCNETGSLYTLCYLSNHFFILIEFKACECQGYLSLTFSDSCSISDSA